MNNDKEFLLELIDEFNQNRKDVASGIIRCPVHQTEDEKEISKYCDEYRVETCDNEAMILVYVPQKAQVRCGYWQQKNAWVLKRDDIEFAEMTFAFIEL